MARKEARALESVEIADGKVVACTADGFTAETTIPRFVDALVEAHATSAVLLPEGVRYVRRSGRLTAWVHVTSPRVHNVLWIRDDSPAPYGPTCTYSERRIALPYVVVIAIFTRDERGHQSLAWHNEVFFATRPMVDSRLELLHAALLNVSLFTLEEAKERKPISWICTQHIEYPDLPGDAGPVAEMTAGLSALLHCLFGTAFNRSSDHHPGERSWYAESVSRKIDDRIATIDAWERATREDPLFVLGVPFIPVRATLDAVIGRAFAIHGETGQAPRDAAALAHHVFKCAGH